VFLTCVAAANSPVAKGARKGRKPPTVVHLCMMLLLNFLKRGKQVEAKAEEEVKQVAPLPPAMVFDPLKGISILKSVFEMP
jgi:hypothetical protein